MHTWYVHSTSSASPVNKSQIFHSSDLTHFTGYALNDFCGIWHWLARASRKPAPAHRPPTSVDDSPAALWWSPSAFDLRGSGNGAGPPPHRMWSSLETCDTPVFEQLRLQKKSRVWRSTASPWRPDTVPLPRTAFMPPTLILKVVAWSESESLSGVIIAPVCPTFLSDCSA